MRRVLRGVGRVLDRGNHGERGTAMVEAAIVIPVLVLLVFGAIEYGLLFKDSARVSSAARAGGRIASAEPKDPAMMLDAANAVATALRGFPITPVPEVWVYQAGANGYPLGASNFSSGCVTDCVAYRLQWNNASGGFFQPVQTGGSWPITDQHVCPGETSATWSRVGVYVKAAHNRLVPNLVPAPSTLTDHAVFRLEPVDSAQCTP